MTKILWDQIGSRQFESGCDRGVLYLPDGTAVAWNGLTSVTEDASDTAVEPYYLDGVRYLNRRVPGDYAGTLKAITYPDEFEQFDGIADLDVGIGATGQPVNETFGLSYRTMVGNDEIGLDYGYKIHLLYNLTAKPDTKTSSSIDSSVSPDEFSWSLTGVPIYIPGMRPSVHLVINSTKLDASHLLMMENFIYGSDSQVASLPDPEILIGFQTDLIFDPITEPL